MDLGLSGHAVVLTGATSGIGRAVATMLAAEGARLLLVARDAEGLERTLGELPGGQHATLSADVADPGSGPTITAACREAHGRIDALVLCAGTSRHAAPDELTPEDWDLQWRINVLGPNALLLAAADDLASAPGGGRAVFVSSSSGKRPSSSNMAYSVGKAAQLSLSRAWAQQLAPRGVRVNAVAPGPIDSEMWLAPGGLAEQAAASSGTTREGALDAARARVPLGRFGTPEEIADVVALLASPRAGFATGGAWSADGGAVATIV
jgi:3-oxoacyl-[acyl-carrier protein] reductase